MSRQNRLLKTISLQWREILVQERDRCFGHSKCNTASTTGACELEMPEIGDIAVGNNTRYPYYYGPEGRLVLVDSALELLSEDQRPLE